MNPEFYTTSTDAMIIMSICTVLTMIGLVTVMYDVWLRGRK